MRRSFLSVLVLASLIVGVESCKKGDTGPAGPAGPTGTPGAVGATGVKGADGTKIYSSTTAPTAAVTGDYWFNPTTRTLSGPKNADGTWPTGVSLAGATGATGATGAAGATGAPGTPGTNGTNGANGATGATGTAGTKIISGAGAPTAGVGAVGDFYFDTNTSIFYGPKTATGWDANQMPLGSAYAAKTFYITAGFENVAAIPQTRVNGQKNAFTWGPVEIGSSYFLNADDLFRISKYPGWGLNREMIFQSNPVTAPGVYDAVPTSAAALGTAPFQVGAKFRYTQNFGAPTQEFTLTQEDIDRLIVDNGNAFNYLTYAAVDQSVNLATAAVGFRLQFHRTKRVDITNLTDAEADALGAYHVQYSAQTNINLNTIPGLAGNIEKYKQDGKVFLKYRYFDNAAGAFRYESGAGSQVGWVDVTNSYLYQYTVAGTSFGPAGSNNTTANVPSFTTTWPSNTGGFLANIFAGNTYPGSTPATVLGGTGYTLNYGVDQNAVPSGVQYFRSGRVQLNWTITSGSNLTNTPTQVPYGPITLVNPNASLNVVADSWVAGTYNTTNTAIPYWSSTILPASGNVYYRAPNELTAYINGVQYTIPANNQVPRIDIVNGKPASFFQGKPLVQLQVYAIPGEMVRLAASKGVNVNNLDALAQFAELNK